MVYTGKDLVSLISGITLRKQVSSQVGKASCPSLWLSQTCPLHRSAVIVRFLDSAVRFKYGKMAIALPGPPVTMLREIIMCTQSSYEDMLPQKRGASRSYISMHVEVSWVTFAKDTHCHVRPSKLDPSFHIGVVVRCLFQIENDPGGNPA